MCTDACQGSAIGAAQPPASGRIKVLACEVMAREIYRIAAESPRAVDVEFMPKGLHDLPSAEMRGRLQARLDALDGGGYDRVALGYGLCSNGLAGLRARRTPLVVPRAHDCITLFLGGRARYQRFFEAYPGCYVLTSGWIERGECDPELRPVSIPSRMGLDGRYEDWVEAYGEENAHYLRETLSSTTQSHYDRYAFIRMGVEPDDRFEREARRRAQGKGWTFTPIQGDMDLLRRLVNGPWDEHDFLCVPPGWRIEADVLRDILRAVSEGEDSEREVRA